MCALHEVDTHRESLTNLFFCVCASLIARAAAHPIRHHLQARAHVELLCVQSQNGALLVKCAGVHKECYPFVVLIDIIHYNKITHTRT